MEDWKTILYAVAIYVVLVVASGIALVIIFPAITGGWLLFSSMVLAAVAFVVIILTTKI